MDIHSINDDIKTWQWIGRIRLIKFLDLINLFIYTIQFGAYEITPNSFFITIQKESFNVLSFKLFQEFLLIIIIRNNMINIIE